MVNPGKSERYCREEWGVGGWGGREGCMGGMCYKNCKIFYIVANS